MDCETNCVLDIGELSLLYFLTDKRLEVSHCFIEIQLYFKTHVNELDSTECPHEEQSKQIQAKWRELGGQQWISKNVVNIGD